jgi:5-bromo-4-chloroindolyl phosphate hydrolysis protein
METTDIEKKSLETHVELCAQRYKYLEEKLETVEQTVINLNAVVREVHDMVQVMSQRNTDRLINWGVGIIVFLTGIVGWLLTHYVLK